MDAIEIARRFAGLGEKKQAVRAYGIAIQETGGQDPEAELEAAAYILQNGGDYKVAYTSFRNLYNGGHFQTEILPLMTAVFYQPNEKMLRTRYEKNCKLLERYPYCFRKDFLPFEELPIQFFPYDEHNGYIPFYHDTMRFGEYVKFDHPVISRNFFKDLEKPILAADVYSQYELEYLNDNVRKSEDVAKENHVYLHYTDWSVFCSYLQCLNLRLLLKDEKLIFLIEDEAEQYPIDFKARYGIDYSINPVKPFSIREINRLVWHTQLSTHNGGDFFNEVFDDHPNLLALTSIMLDNMENVIQTTRENITMAKGSKDVSQQILNSGSSSQATKAMWELSHMQDPSDKDIMVGYYLSNSAISGRLNPAERISPAVFFQPHFSNIVYSLEVDEANRTMLTSEQYDKTVSSPIFRGFKYIKTFTPMRRFTTSHGATVQFMYNSALHSEENEDGKTLVVPDAVSQRILNRSFMIDWQDRLYADSILVRFEDGKLNPKATFTALCAFLDLPYTATMTYCSEFGKPLDYGGYIAGGFDPKPIYKTYDKFVNDSERKYIEYFLRDAYEYFGYDFQYYDGQPMTEEQLDELTEDFSTVDHYIRETWEKLYKKAEVTVNDDRIDPEAEEKIQMQLLDGQLRAFHENRQRNTRILMRGLQFINRHGQPLRMMSRLELDPELLENPVYH